MNQTQNCIATSMDRAESVVTKKPIGIWRQWREDIASVFERDPAARTTLEVILTYPGVHTIILHRISHRLWRRNYRLCARLLSYFIRLSTNIDIHPGAVIGRRFFIDHGAGVVIGETAVIGDDCTLYHGVTLGGTSWNPGKRHPTLGNGVMVGAGAKILGAITLGDHARVGANSVVIADVPAKQTVVGIPGRIVHGERNVGFSPDSIDLNHHLIPDPVGKAISCLMDRIQQLETQLGKNNNDACPTCDGVNVCEPSSLQPKSNHSGV